MFLKLSTNLRHRNSFKMPMRILLITLLFLLIAKVNQAQEQETSGTFNNKFYVRIDTLPELLKKYTIYNGEIGFITIYIDNGIDDATGYHTRYFGAKLVTLKKDSINTHDVISYQTFNKFLVKNFWNMIT
jgi:hypothetical protein